MQASPAAGVTRHQLSSVHLGRMVDVDLYQAAAANPLPPALLLLNDGQDLKQIGFASMLGSLTAAGLLRPLVCVGIHAGPNRIHEYGVAGHPDYAGRGAGAANYSRFVCTELLPFLHTHSGGGAFDGGAIAGFSLGGLSALDLAWQHPHLFRTVGVFSGSLWWRSRDLGPGYSDRQHRIMHQVVRNGTFRPGLRFYFTTGSLDETADRNNNGIIDSIDDTLDLVKELRQKGYSPQFDIAYHNYADGRHDVESWGRALPAFLQWGWGR